MQTLLYDILCTQPTGTTKYHGGGEYGKRLFRKIAESAPDPSSITVCLNEAAFLDEWLCSLIRNADIPVINVASAEEVQNLVETGRFSKFYSALPYNYSFSKHRSPTRLLGTIHGLRPIEVPADKYEHCFHHGFYKKAKSLSKRIISHNYLSSKYIKFYKDNIDSLDLIFTDSEHSRAAIQTYLGLNKDIEVYYPAPTTDIDEAEGSESPYEQLSDRYVLMISCDRWLKNPVRGTLALDSLFSSGLLGGYRVVCVGSTKVNFPVKLANQKRFSFLPYVSSAMLQELYRRCDIFFYPTLNEGFGYPPVEAMKYGKTCVVSAVCSVPEVCGEAAYYCNPYDIGEMKTRLVQASHQHIDEGLVLSRYNHITQRQRRDLDSLANRILNS